MPEMTSPDEEILKIEPQEMIGQLILLLLTISVAALLSALKWKPRVPGFLEPIVHEDQVVYYIAALLLLMILVAIKVWGKWRERRRHVWGKVRPQRKALWIAEIVGDDKDGSHRTNVIVSLRDELHQEVDVLRAGVQLDLKETGTANEDFNEADKKARDILEKRGGDLLIWGKVLKANQVVLWLYFSTRTLKVPANKRLKLDDLQQVPELPKALAAVAAGLVMNKFQLPPPAALEVPGALASPPVQTASVSDQPVPDPVHQLWEGFWWIVGETHKNVASVSGITIQTIAEDATQALQTLGPLADAISQASRTMGVTAPQLEQDALNEAARAGWALLAVQESSNEENTCS
jgi:hypothetical protein